VEARDAESLAAWTGRSDDLVEFAIAPVLTSADFRAKIQAEYSARTVRTRFLKARSNRLIQGIITRREPRNAAAAVTR
jgi:hypothetical protein